MSTRLTLGVCFLAMVLNLAGCATRTGARQLSGTYVHRPTEGVIIFHPNGEFYYSFTTPAKTQPQNVGHYRFDKLTDSVPRLSVRSAHSGQFRIRVSETGDRVFLTHPRIFTGEEVYEKQ